MTVLSLINQRANPLLQPLASRFVELHEIDYVSGNFTQAVLLTIMLSCLRVRKMLSQPFHRQLGPLLFVDVAIQQLEIAKSMSAITEIFDPVVAHFYAG